MKIQVLAKVRQLNDEWLAEAFHGQGVFCTVQTSSEAKVMDELQAQVEQALAGEARLWLNNWQGTPRVPNCPEGKIKLPIDLWYCKLKDIACPIQAQVFLDEPEQFFQHCLAPEERKRQIFDTIATGKYGGFHHVPGRYLCVSCEQEGKSGSFSYYYPWELTNLGAYYPSIERDERDIRRKLIREGITVAATYSALCARHCKELATHLDPDLGAQLRVLNFNLYR